MPNTGSGTPLGQSSQSGTRLTAAWAEDAGADPCAADVPVEIPPVVGDGAAAARALGIVLMLPDEALPGTADREPVVVALGDIDPTTPVLVAAVGGDAAPYGATVVGAGMIAAEPIDVVVPTGPLVMLPVLVPVCPVTWPAAGAASPTLSSNASLNECAIAIPHRGMDDHRSNGNLGEQFRRRSDRRVTVPLSCSILSHKLPLRDGPERGARSPLIHVKDRRAPRPQHEYDAGYVGEVIMQIRTILAAVSGGSASYGAVETACRLARRFKSYLEGLHVAVSPQLATWAAAEPPLTGALVEAMTREADEAAATARKVFDTAVARHALPLGVAATPSWKASASWHEETGFDTAAVARRARLFSMTIERTLLTAGRPVLVTASTPLEKLGDTVAVAWNDTPEASRALSAAMPFLMQASETHILCFGDMRMDDLIQQLAWYGVRAVGHCFHPLSEQRAETGELLFSATRNCRADLLVMGAYGHAPWWEFLFGGATREVLNKNSFPILLAH